MAGPTWSGLFAALLRHLSPLWPAYRPDLALEGGQERLTVRAFAGQHFHKQGGSVEGADGLGQLLR